MTLRFVETEQERTMLVRFIEQHKLPFAASISKGSKRSTRQNRLQAQWLNEIAQQLTEDDAEGWRGFCKLHFGVPILRGENEPFREVYDRLIRPMDYEAKIEAMRAPLDLAVTRLMTTKQMTAYLDAMHRHFSALGVVLTDPGDLLNQADDEARDAA